jgi:hypothetical protein
MFMIWYLRNKSLTFKGHFLAKKPQSSIRMTFSNWNFNFFFIYQNIFFHYKMYFVFNNIHFCVAKKYHFSSKLIFKHFNCFLIAKKVHSPIYLQVVSSFDCNFRLFSEIPCSAESVFHGRSAMKFDCWSRAAKKSVAFWFNIFVQFNRK